MHMARLLDTSRGLKGYSLAALTEDYKVVINKIKNELVPLTDQRLRN